jgi:DNA-binding NarL/FixJ family response regulator
MKRTDDDQGCRAIVVDDTPLMHVALDTVLAPASELTLVGHALDIATGLALLREQEPDLLIFDVYLDGSPTGMELARYAASAHPDLTLFAFTNSTDLFAYQQLVQLGIRGYLRKRATGERVVQAVQMVCTGHTVLDLSPAEAALLHRRFHPEREGHTVLDLSPAEAALAARLAALTDREYVVLHGLAAGLGNAAIARLLGRSEKTAEAQVRRVMDRLGAASRAEAASIAYRLGLTPSDLSALEH